MALLPYFGLCLLGLIIVNPFLAAEANSCPRKWFRYQGNCYGYFDTAKTWDNAEVECQKISPRCHLASFLNQAETRLVARYLSRYPNVRNVWMGLHYPDQNRLWKWADGSVYYYKAWMEGEPNNQGGHEFCVELTSSTGFQKWNDVYCEKPNTYICKYASAGVRSGVLQEKSPISLPPPRS